MRRTSIDGQVSDHSTDPTHMNAVLWDFDVDGTDLKSKHTKWLDDATKRVNTSNRSLIWRISVSGEASLTGTWIDNNRHNSALAAQRADVVTKYLKDGLTGYGLDFDPPFNAGTMLASLSKHPVGVENDEDRCAVVVITTDTIPPPPPPRPTSIPLSKRWAIRYVWGDSVSAIIVGADAAKYDVADLTNHLHVFYEYSGDAIAASISKLPLSITAGGNWKEFWTSDAIHISDFEGPARFTTTGVGPLSNNYLRLTPKGGATISEVPLKISTGMTYGAPGGSVGIPGTGWFWLKTTKPMSYSGLYPP